MKSSTYRIIELRYSIMGFRHPTARLLPTEYSTRDEAAEAVEQFSRHAACFDEGNVTYCIRLDTVAKQAVLTFQRKHDIEVRQWRYEVYNEPPPYADELDEIQMVEPILKQC